METNFEISPRFSNYIGDRMCTLLNWARLGLDTYTCTLCNYMYNCYWCCSCMSIDWIIAGMWREFSDAIWGICWWRQLRGCNSHWTGEGVIMQIFLLKTTAIQHKWSFGISNSSPDTVYMYKLVCLQICVIWCWTNNCSCWHNLTFNFVKLLVCIIYMYMYIASC